MKIFSGILVGVLIVCFCALAVDKRLEDRSGRFAVEIQGHWGFMDVKGEVLIDPVFDRVGFFSEGMASVRIDNKWGYIDPNGKMVIPPTFTYADYFSQGLAAVSKDGKMGYIDKKGTLVMPAQFDEAFAFSQGLARVRRMHQWGYINPEGRFAVAPQFEDAQDFSEDVAAVLYADQWGFVDRQGNYIFEARFDNTYEFHEGWAEVSIDGEQNFINKNGQYMTDGMAFLEAQNFFQGLAAAQSVQNGKYGYIDQTASFKIPAQYDLVFPFNEGLAAVSRSGSYGFINRNGKEVIPLKYAFAEVFIGGLAKVKSGVRWEYIDNKGNTIWPQDRSTQKIPIQEVEIQYDMAGLTQVFLKDGRLKYINSEYQGSAQTATGSPEAYSRSSEGTEITAAELEALLKLIQDSGFLDLKNTYGTTAEDRHYPVRISIKTESIEKSVFYRSHPDFPAPKAFQQVEKALLDLAQEKIKNL